MLQPIRKKETDHHL